MKKKKIMGLLTAGCMIMLCACAGKEELPGVTVTVEELPAEEAVPEASQEDAADTAATDEAAVPDADEEVTEEAAQEEAEVQQAETQTAGVVVMQSDLGYTMSYDTSALTLNTVDGREIYTYHDADGADEGVYIAVSRYANTDAKALAEKVAAESGVEGTEVMASYFGSVSVETQEVYVMQETDGKQIIRIYHAIPVEGDALLVETAGYVGMPEAVDMVFEETLAGFTTD